MKEEVLTIEVGLLIGSLIFLVGVIIWSKYFDK